MLTGEPMMATRTTLDHVRDLLDRNRSEEALSFLDRHGPETPEVENARAVCLLRLGRLSDAIAILRDITFRGHMNIPDDTPLRFQLNFATAMLMINFKDGAMAVMDRLKRQTDPQAVQLREAIDRWRESLGLIGRLGCCVGLYPRQPVELGFPPGRV
jgi:hypothetical protein